MFKTTLTIVMAALCLNFSSKAQSPDNKKPSQKQTITGKVISASNNEILPGAAIKITSTNQTIVTNDKGEFTINLASGKYNLSVYYLSYKAKNIVIEVPLKEPLIITLQTDEQTLKEVEIVSTGYQKLPKERATGSFEVVDNKLFNRSTGTDVFSRLDAVTTGTLFLKGNSTLRKTPFNGLIIRGISGLHGQRPPLIILDNFPYHGDPNDLNPNDVENVTLLKDAAAASIWGTRAGNGVIVITTKKGNLNQPFQVNLNANVTFMDKPDLKYLKSISSSDYIEVEKMLFSKGFYNGYLDPASPFTALSPVVELLAKQQDEGTDQAVVNALTDSWGKQDVRNDFLKYVYRVATKQQYALTLSGGDQKTSYLLSAGDDKNLDNLRASNYRRKTFRFNASAKPLPKLEIQAGIFYTKSKERLNSSGSPIGYGEIYLGSDIGLYPYAKLADENGRPLEIAAYYRAGFTDTVGRGMLQDWKYRPLQDMQQNFNQLQTQSVIINTGVKYDFNQVFSAEIKYQYEEGTTQQEDRYGKDSFFSRNEVNLFTQFDKDKITSQPVPTGDILKNFNRNYTAQTIRSQFNLNKSWTDLHQLNAIVGAEVRENSSKSGGAVMYGYNPETLTFQNVDFSNNHLLLNGLLGQVPISGFDPNSLTRLTDRFISVFANAAYIYHNRYVASVSIRKDEANLFGLATNAKGLPLWSAGLSWNISNEDFYHLTAIPFLKLRTTYGYSGNADNSVPAFATISYSPGVSPTNYPYAGNNNPPNSKLRWEKVGMLNLGLDFALKNNLISGSVEYYHKRSTDILASAPVDPSTGFQSLTHNSAIVNGKGIEIRLNSRNLNSGDFKWNTDLLFSYNKSVVERYLLKQARTINYVSSSGAINPAQGQDVWGMYAFKFAGLDHDTGSPVGLFNGEQSMDYTNILNKSKLENLQYFGSSKPLYYGALRNTFQYKGFTLSANISFRFAYYFRKTGLNYYNLFNYGIGHSDFSGRWKNPGDESFTNVPAMDYEHQNLYNREQFYAYSTALVGKGDNIRLEDVNLSYTFKQIKHGFRNLKIYGNLTNAGILWKANKMGIDPDYGYATNNIPPARTLVFGATVNF